MPRDRGREDFLFELNQVPLIRKLLLVEKLRSRKGGSKLRR